MFMFDKGLIGLILMACLIVSPVTVYVSDQIDPANVPSENGFPAFVDSIDILILESFPAQVHVKVKGQLSTPCMVLNPAEQNLDKDSRTITISLTMAEENKSGGCADVIVPFETTVPLQVNGLAKGQYTVIVNTVTGTFNLPIDNEFRGAP